MSRQTLDYFGTVSALFLYVDESDPQGTERFLEAWAETKALLAEIEKAVSLSAPESDLSRFNALPAGQSMPISAHTASILQTAKDAYANTAGLFDPTVYPLVDLWGFSPRFNVNNYRPTQPYDRQYMDGKLPMPEDAYIQALLPLVDFSGIALTEDGTNGYVLTKNTPSVTIDGKVFHAQLDLGGIAKGYAADRVAALMREKGYAYGHFVCGGSSMVFLENLSERASARDPRAYATGIRRPREGQGEGTSFLTMELKNTSLSSSGDYSHNRIYNNILYCHTIDPRTGYPVNTPVDSVQQGIAAVTVTGPLADYCDAISTALFLMGPQEAIRYANQSLTDYNLVMVLYRVGSERYEVVTNLRDTYAITDSAYQLASSINDAGEIIYHGSLFPLEEVPFP